MGRPRLDRVSTHLRLSPELLDLCDAEAERRKTLLGAGCSRAEIVNDILERYFADERPGVREVIEAALVTLGDMRVWAPDGRITLLDVLLDSVDVPEWIRLTAKKLKE